MTEKEVAEIRRRFKQEKSGITHVRGCYVNDQGEIVSEFDQVLSAMGQEEEEKILATLKRTLSGALGKNLLDIAFSNDQVVQGEEHKLLMTLRDSGLKDEAAVRAFFEKVIKTVAVEGGYLLLLATDSYDVPYRAKDGEELEDGSTEVYRYILCSVCPVKMTKPALGYSVHENQFHNCKLDWVVAPPELGFLFPAFDDRSANIYNALYYTKDTAENHQDFVDAVFSSQLPMPAAVQKETFQALLGETLADDCSLDVVHAVNEQLCGLIETSKADKEAPPLALSKGEVRQVLHQCGVSEERATAFEQKYEEAFGANMELNPRNVVEKKLEVRMPDVTVQVNPQRPELVQTRVIDGVKYIMILADENVVVNGVNIHIG